MDNTVLSRCFWDRDVGSVHGSTRSKYEHYYSLSGIKGTKIVLARTWSNRWMYFTETLVDLRRGVTWFPRRCGQPRYQVLRESLANAAAKSIQQKKRKTGAFIEFSALPKKNLIFFSLNSKWPFPQKMSRSRGLALKQVLRLDAHFTLKLVSRLSASRHQLK